MAGSPFKLSSTHAVGIVRFYVTFFYHLAASMLKERHIGIKKKRNVLTFQQVQTLMQTYHNTRYPDVFVVECLAKTTGLAEKRVCFFIKVLKKLCKKQMLHTLKLYVLCMRMRVSGEYPLISAHYSYNLEPIISVSMRGHVNSVRSFNSYYAFAYTKGNH